jgi:hypothetical protein
VFDVEPFKRDAGVPLAYRRAVVRQTVEAWVAEDAQELSLPVTRGRSRRARASPSAPSRTRSRGIGRRGRRPRARTARPGER